MIKGHGVIWKEGIALLPQHFQLQDALHDQALFRSLAASVPYYWGFSSLTIDSQLLASGTVRLTAGKGYFRDGTSFDIQQDGEPPPLKLEPSVRPIPLHLGLTFDQQQPPDGEDSSRCRFSEEYVSAKDNYSPHATTEKVAVKKPNYCLLTGADDLSGFHTIPLGVATANADTGEIQLRGAFVPPLLNYKASPFLKSIVKELQASFEKKGTAIAQTLSESVLESRISWEEIFYLRSINRGLTELRALAGTERGFHPFELFNVLQRSVADLATICESTRMAPPIEPYDHDDICHSFTILMIKMREYLRKVITQKVFKFPLNKEQLGYWTCQISNAAFYTEYDLFIEVCQRDDGQLSADKIEALLRAANLDEIEALRKTNIKGLKLVAVSTPPIYLPVKRSGDYFKILKKGDDWQRLSQSSGIGIHFASHLDQVDINLYAVKL